MTQTRIAGQQARIQAPPRPGVRLTGRGGVVVLFAVCFAGLLVAAWTGWTVVADVLFVMTCGLVSCYTRPGGLRSLVVSPPLAFCAGSILAQLITAADSFAALTGVLVTLGTSTLWLFTGTALTMAIALGRGWRPQTVLSLLASLRGAVRDSRSRGGVQWTERRYIPQQRNGKAPDHHGRLTATEQTAVPSQVTGAKPPG